MPCLHHHRTVRLVPVRHLPIRTLHRALPLRRRVLLRQARRAQVRLARNGRSLHRRARVCALSDGRRDASANTLRDGTCAAARADAVSLARHSPTIHQSRERASVHLRLRLHARLGVRRPNIRIASRRADPALPLDILILPRCAFLFFSFSLLFYYYLPPKVGGRWGCFVAESHAFACRTAELRPRPVYRRITNGSTPNCARPTRKFGSSSCRWKVSRRTRERPPRHC